MRSRSARVVVPGLGVLALLGVVVIASRGSVSLGSGGTRVSAVDQFLDVVLSLFIVAVVVGGVLLVYGLSQRKAIAEEYARQRRNRRSALLFAVSVVLFAVVAAWRLRHLHHAPPGDQQQPILGRPRPNVVNPGPTAEHLYQPHFAWLPVLVVVMLIVVGIGALWLSERRRRAAPDERETVEEALADVLDDTLDDLLAEADPRKAVIAAYARLERVLAGHGLPRRAAETPGEYLTRVFGRLEVGTESVRRLTDLFTRAKFSDHEVDEEMKQGAIAALRDTRDELRAARARAEPVLAPSPSAVEPTA